MSPEWFSLIRFLVYLWQLKKILYISITNMGRWLGVKYQFGKLSKMDEFLGKFRRGEGYLQSNKIISDFGILNEHFCSWNFQIKGCREKNWHWKIPKLGEGVGGVKGCKKFFQIFVHFVESGHSLHLLIKSNGNDDDLRWRSKDEWPPPPQRLEEKRADGATFRVAFLQKRLSRAGPLRAETRQTKISNRPAAKCPVKTISISANLLEIQKETNMQKQIHRNTQSQHIRSNVPSKLFLRTKVKMQEKRT